MARRPHHLIAVLLLAPFLACSAPILSLDDALTDGDDLKLIAYVETEPVLGFRTDVEHAPVTFFCDGREIGRDKTDDEGRASISWDDPPPDASLIEARCNHAGTSMHAQARLFRWDPERTIIVLDIDHTIADTEYEELIFEPTDDESDPIDDARRTLESLSVDYHEIYVTGRPRFLLEKTRQWLAEHRFPPGPVITARGIRDTINPQRYKTRVLKSLRDDWPGIAIGIGNKHTDAQAYGAAGLLPLIIPRKRDEIPHIDRHALVFKNWKSIRDFFHENRQILLDRDQLRRAIEGKRMLQSPLLKYRSNS